MAGPDPAIHAFLSETMGAMAKSPCRRNSSPSPSRSAASGVWCNKPLQRYRQQTKTNHLTRTGMGFNPLTPSLRGGEGFDLPAPSWRGGAADEAIHLSLRRKKMNCHAVSHDVVGESKPMPAGITRNLRSGVCQSLARLLNDFDFVQPRPVRNAFNAATGQIDFLQTRETFHLRELGQKPCVGKLEGFQIRQVIQRWKAPYAAV
jgi:hypothetical protein